VPGVQGFRNGVYTVARTRLAPIEVTGFTMQGAVIPICFADLVRLSRSRRFLKPLRIQAWMGMKRIGDALRDVIENLAIALKSTSPTSPKVRSGVINRCPTTAHCTDYYSRSRRRSE
jgi:hypothetical protein